MRDLHFPTGLCFDAQGTLFITESGIPLDGAPAGGRVWRVERNGQRRLLRDGLGAPVTGVHWHGETLYVSQGGQPGRILAIDPNTGSQKVLVDDLPSGGNYHTNTPFMAPDGWLYFGQGSATNSGIVGPDGRDMPWLREHAHSHDLPGYEIVLSGEDVTTDNPAGGPPVTTGGFAPFGRSQPAGSRIPAQTPCTSGVMRCRPDGSSLEVVAWGLRNPYGLGALPNGRLIAVDLGLNDRGSRPVRAAEACLFELHPGRWYGWPDYAAGVPVTAPELCPTRTPLRQDQPQPPPQPASFLLSNHEALGPPVEPLFRFPRHAAPTHALPVSNDELLVCLFGDKLPLTGPPGPRAGRGLARVDLRRGEMQMESTPPLHRPIDLAIDPTDGSLHVLDFGRYELQALPKLEAQAGSGRVWKVG